MCGGFFPTLRLSDISLPVAVEAEAVVGRKGSGVAARWGPVRP